jgi:predicted acylesterase/phospholipase RssA
MTRVVRIALALIVVQFGAVACATLTRQPAEPPALVAEAVPAVPNSRYLVWRETATFAEEARQTARRRQAWLATNGPQGHAPTLSMLAISGGGDSGAFAAGLLNGWSAEGTRPEFEVVSGVSTGALIAPFAFLGPKYDPVLKSFYTTVSQRDIFKPRNIIVALFGDAISDTTPLSRMVQHNVDQPLLDAIAAEYAKGRLLLVGTTNLDTMEPVIWNMTAIAASHDARALGLFQKILLASAAIPGVFPPVMIDVTVDGAVYQEMHVDGGTTAQVFAYPPSFHLETVAAEGTCTLYVIRNARFDPEWASVQRRTLLIAGRAVSALIQTQGVGDLYRMYVTAQRDGVDYNLASIPPTFNVKHAEQFDTVYMQALYKTGYDMAASGCPWQKVPPGFASDLAINPE